MPFGEPVNTVVEDDIGHVEVAPAAVDEISGADTVAIAVATHRHHCELMVRELRAGGDRQRAAVQRVEAVGVDVVGRFPRTADAGNHRDSMWRDLQLKERLLDRAQDSEIATAGTPIDVDLCLVLLQAEFLGRGDRLRHEKP